MRRLGNVKWSDRVTVIYVRSIPKFTCMFVCGFICDIATGHTNEATIMKFGMKGCCVKLQKRYFLFFEILIIFLVRGLNVFFSFTFFVFFWRKFTFCAQGTVLMLELRYLAYIILEFFSKGDIFSIFEF